MGKNSISFSVNEKKFSVNQKITKKFFDGWTDHELGLLMHEWFGDIVQSQEIPDDIHGVYYVDLDRINSLVDFILSGKDKKDLKTLLEIEDCVIFCYKNGVLLTWEKSDAVDALVKYINQRVNPANTNSKMGAKYIIYISTSARFSSRELLQNLKTGGERFTFDEINALLTLSCKEQVEITELDVNYSIHIRDSIVIERVK